MPLPRSFSVLSNRFEQVFVGSIFRLEEEFHSMKEMEEAVEEHSYKRAVNCWLVFLHNLGAVNLGVVNLSKIF